MPTAVYDTQKNFRTMPAIENLKEIEIVPPLIVEVKEEPKQEVIEVKSMPESPDTGSKTRLKNSPS